MNAKEIKELQEEICRTCKQTGDWKISWKVPHIRTRDANVEGISLRIEKNESVRSEIECLQLVAEKRKLKVMETIESYIIYTPRAVKATES